VHSSTFLQTLEQSTGSIEVDGNALYAKDISVPNGAKDVLASIIPDDFMPKNERDLIGMANVSHGDASVAFLWWLIICVNFSALH
jgi:hypothetical protein